MITDVNKEPSATINDLPDEVLQHIINLLSPLDVVSIIQKLSTRFNKLSNEPLLWRYYCRDHFQYWDSKHRIQLKFQSKADEVDWKSLYSYRWNVDIKTTELLNGIIECQTGRIARSSCIADFGYDAKDTLIRHSRVTEEAEDVLARRYYALAVLDHLHRARALNEWDKLRKGEVLPLEHALGSFDLFVLHDQYGDLLEISNMLDNLILRLRNDVPYINGLSARKKALEIVSFLRRSNLTGLSPDHVYRDLPNNFIGVALKAVEHPSLPLTSATIFCALAQRLDLDARCVNMPNHVHAMVLPNSQVTLDGRPATDETGIQEPMYLDPFQLDTEISSTSVRALLAQWGISEANVSTFLAASPTDSLVLRFSRNLLASCGAFEPRHPRIHPSHLDKNANPHADRDSAFYSALWAMFLLPGNSSGIDIDTRPMSLPMIVSKIERFYPMDTSLIEQYISPVYDSIVFPEPFDLQGALRAINLADETPRKVRARHSIGFQDKVKYKVGQFFLHRRYRYIAIIIGWDVECSMPPSWISNNDVDMLSHGKYQSFYTTIAQDTSIRYVAEENIEIIGSEVPPTLMGLAGKYFKRYDERLRMFISNIRNEYPDD